MSAGTVVVNPDRFAAQRAFPARLSPASMRRKLADAGLDQRLARAPKPEFPRPTLNYNRLLQISEQLRWTHLLLEMVSR